MSFVLAELHSSGSNFIKRKINMTEFKYEVFWNNYSDFCTKNYNLPCRNRFPVSANDAKWFLISALKFGTQLHLIVYPFYICYAPFERLVWQGLYISYIIKIKPHLLSWYPLNYLWLLYKSRNKLRNFKKTLHSANLTFQQIFRAFETCKIVLISLVRRKNYKDIILKYRLIHMTLRLESRTMYQDLSRILSTVPLP